MRFAPLILATTLPFILATYDRVCRQDSIPCTQLLCVGLGWVGSGWVPAREFNYDGPCPSGSSEIARITPSLDTTAPSASTLGSEQMEMRDAPQENTPAHTSLLDTQHLLQRLSMLLMRNNNATLLVNRVQLPPSLQPMHQMSTMSAAAAQAPMSTPSEIELALLRMNQKHNQQLQLQLQQMLSNAATAAAGSRPNTG